VSSTSPSTLNGLYELQKETTDALPSKFRRITAATAPIRSGARSSDTAAIGLDSEETGPAAAGPAIVVNCMKLNLWTRWVTPFWPNRGWRRRLFFAPIMTVFLILFLFLFGLVRTFRFFVRHRPIHTHRSQVEQPINVEEVCSVRVIFSLS
jgi:hypothetical protein